MQIVALEKLLHPVQKLLLKSRKVYDVSYCLKMNNRLNIGYFKNGYF
jgi:hypothetical protein